MELAMVGGGSMELELSQCSSSVSSPFINWTLDLDLPFDFPDWSTAASDSALEDEVAVRLTHLLMAAAESLEDRNPELAQVILARLNQLLLSSPGGPRLSAAERLAQHFTAALFSLLSAASPPPPPPPPPESLEALQLLQDTSPYLKFAYFTANQAILEATAGERRVHVVDLDVKHGVQWASLIQSLSGAALPPHLRITAVGPCRRSALEAGRRLSDFAASVGLPFSFGFCRAGERVRVARGETVALNCALSQGSARLNSSATALGARVVAVVEEESQGVGFVGRFVEEMERYSAIWDALEASFEEQGRAREVVERAFLGPGIVGAVGRAFCGEGERDGQRMRAAGLIPVGLSFFNVCQARLLLGLFNDGYRIEEDGSNKLVLYWKSSRLLSASVWSPAEIPAFDRR